MEEGVARYRDLAAAQPVPQLEIRDGRLLRAPRGCSPSGDAAPSLAVDRRSAKAHHGQRRADGRSRAITASLATPLATRAPRSLRPSPGAPRLLHPTLSLARSRSERNHPNAPELDLRPRPADQGSSPSSRWKNQTDVDTARLGHAAHTLASVATRATGETHRRPSTRGRPTRRAIPMPLTLKDLRNAIEEQGLEWQPIAGRSNTRVVSRALGADPSGLPESRDTPPTEFAEILGSARIRIWRSADSSAGSSRPRPSPNGSRKLTLPMRAGYVPPASGLQPPEGGTAAAIDWRSRFGRELDHDRSRPEPVQRLLGVRRHRPRRGDGQDRGCDLGSLVGGRPPPRRSGPCAPTPPQPRLGVELPGGQRPGAPLGSFLWATNNPP